MNATDKEAQLREVEDLLPWHAAGTLSRRDAQRVEQALAQNPELSRHYEQVREELAETIHLNESLGAPSARAMERLMAKIDAEPARKAPASLHLGARLAGFFGHLAPRTLAWSAAIAVLVVVVQAGFLTDLALKQSGSSYQTASLPNAASATGSFTLIRFAPQASFDDINKFLQDNKLSIVSGPVAGGLYKVRVSDSQLPQAELGQIVKKLQGNKVVSFIVTSQ